MTELWWIVVCVLLLNIAIGLGVTTVRRGRADALLAVLLFGTVGVALVLALGQALNRERAVDLALVLALLAAVLGVAGARLGWFSADEEGKLQR